MLQLSLEEQKQINGGQLVFIVTISKGSYSKCLGIFHTVTAVHALEEKYGSYGYTVTVDTKRTS